ncbi:VIT family protein [Nitrosomonas sp.]|uniref:VIT1/CCC1 transporter family protein n=1 Tax=Nitrosomonas sp. TaxID=42353 RepID=UPI0025FB4168|nr:VIT family protein [Nitrosomonas sp.]MCC6915852.1 VIT family protein [Nitrosomonas sp.]
MAHDNNHYSHRSGWLRAAVLGANDGIVSIASLIIGVAAASTTVNEIVLAGVAGLVAGAMSMAAGEYVSVSSQSDTEKADIALEQYHLDRDIDFELQELTDIYIKRGLQPELASQVAEELMAHDALDAHLRDELGLHERTNAKPIQAAFTSAGMFTVGASIPLAATIIAPAGQIIPTVAASSLLALAALGAEAAYLGRANIVTGTARVIFWGALAMGFTALTGIFFGIVA